ncbi:MAG: hypothetical protein A3C84_05175 [Candidatus Ryanbacteria bacterium RIFCSPHIGHO2_02_FULL_48_12]|uniref:ZIP zinc transporter n=1 Tax=Candidatus Ryanbacteria bacterium RIFCSPHIGHO2_01_FULL_48_27 TaxID=1802115 RepID=A0A1G2G7G1_9BACT|nr:MAG: hypothetical protein A2756_05950 [Candidatus Ryanbacteria bacterium RIFCSPHIGHO2_01_FULL_48_27]OGZ49553.1 MAG: hypothetical protein A3C84_05175 [Candidatus Ryanbacteria bacterium RIFCSPHIGHO2_02_FULL_48_12]
MTLLGLIIVYSLIGGVLSTTLASLLLLREDLMRRASIYLLSFAAGTILATAFFELLPEALESLKIYGKDPADVFLYTFLGLITFFILEGVLFHLHHHHISTFEDQPDDEHASASRATSLLIIGDMLHNFLDGIAIAATFIVDPSLGIITALAIATHEIPQEIGDFSIMIHAGWSRSKALFWNIVPSLLTVLGAIITYFAKDLVEPIIGQLLAFTAGFFIYLASTDLVPELYHSTRQEKITKTFPPFFIGILIIILLTRFIAE